MNKIIPSTLLTVALTVTSGLALAQAPARTPDGARSILPMTDAGYVGGSFGQSQFDLGCAGGFDCDRNHWGFKAYAGGRLWRFLGLELGYVDMGKAHSGGGSLRARGANLSVLGNVPIGPAVLFGKVGSTYGFTDNTGTLPGTDNGKDRGFGVSYGAGVGFNVTARWQVRAEWDRYRFVFKGNGDQVDLYSVGLAYNF